MKKLLFFSVLVALIATSCQKGNVTGSIIGSWKNVSTTVETYEDGKQISTNTVEFGPEDPYTLYTFNADKTFSASLVNGAQTTESVSGTYELSGESLTIKSTAGTSTIKVMSLTGTQLVLQNTAEAEISGKKYKYVSTMNFKRI